LEVDGGVKLSNVQAIVAAGANVMVAGSAVFGGEHTIRENLAAFQTAVNAHAYQGPAGL
jgi:ribulose-phosphate 3-epimerase